MVNAIESKWSLSCLHAGGNILDGIKEFGFTFLKNKKVSLEEARKLEVDIIEFLMNRINNDAKLKPYLEHPFKEDKIRVRLVFGKREFCNFRDGVSMYEVLPKEGRLLYHRLPYSDPKGPWIILTPDVLADESYEESRKLSSVLKK